MIFRRREPAPLRERLRVALWPRRSWSRSAAYAGKRVIRLPATPHAIAAGVAAGVFASFTPFMGLHIVIALALAWMISGNLIASALGTLVGNPLTFPAIWAATYWTGTWLLSGSVDAVSPLLAAPVSFVEGEALLPEQPSGAGFWGPVLKPMVIGGLPLGLLAGMLFYFPVRKLVASFQAARALRIGAAGRRS